jgi:peptide alpha-N-acetyltransferase
MSLTLGDDFRIAVDKYLRAFLCKGVPSTFVSLKFLYNDPQKRSIIQDLAESYLASLKSDRTFPPPLETTSQQPNGTSDTAEPPTTFLWTLYFLALHYAHPVSARDVTKSLALIEEAIAHTPTLVELHLTKARLLKYQGDLSAAVDAIMVARDLDMQDRFVNTKVGKYLLRCNRNDEALQILKEFTRPDSPGGPLADLTDMQCMWFAIEDGESYMRQKKYGLALKRFHTIWKVQSPIRGINCSILKNGKKINTISIPTPFVKDQ